MSRPRIVLFLDNVNMGWGHLALQTLARKYGVRMDTLERTDLVLFINRAKDKLKILGGGGVVLGYLRMPKGRINLEALQYIPETFGAGGWNYDEALRRTLEQRLTKASLPNPSVAWRQTASR